ncbi:bifunctional UDP-N-acetylglucosamine diphosphorylase/glucosamine-1-phosphate N-acetyltransferase GlmU, partial [bacterium]|nr:bifunctional UDP-N-acetylglucosamine diphosphorylase/glucosamine-1-phosphate N-acetyltransferase GlmU [bacterium]
PKVLHPVNNKPLILYSIQAAKAAGSDRPIVIIGNGAEAVKKTVGDGARFVLQAERLGTAHAVMMAEAELIGMGELVLVIAGDMPLLTSETLRQLVQKQTVNKGPLTMLTVHSNNPRGFGRILRGMDGEIRAIVEEAQASADELQIDELNVGAYCFNSEWLWKALKKITLSPKGEYYLTDLIGIAVAEGSRVDSIQLEDEEEALGVNNRIHLAEAERIIRRRVNEVHMLAGVSMIDPNLVYIEEGVAIGKDTVLHPGTRLSGGTHIGEGCEIGPNTIIDASTIGNHCHLLASVIEGAVLGDNVGMGPFCHLRKGAQLGNGVHMGNFGEVKDSTLAAGVK